MILRSISLAYLANLSHAKWSQTTLDQFFSETSKDDTNAYSINKSDKIEDLKLIYQYGCWCNFKEQPYLQRGFGEPVDEFDKACKQLVENYICAYEESYSEGYTDCEPWSVDWSLELWNRQFDDISLAQGCKESNYGDVCIARACHIEEFFVEQLFGNLIDGNRPNPKYNRNNGFDHQSYCGSHGTVTKPTEGTKPETKSPKPETKPATKPTTKPTTKKTTAEADTKPPKKSTTEAPTTQKKTTSETTKPPKKKTTTTQAPTTQKRTTTTTAKKETTTTKTTTTTTTTPNTQKQEEQTTKAATTASTTRYTGKITKFYKAPDYDGNVGPNTDTYGNQATPKTANQLFGVTSQQTTRSGTESKFQYGCWCNFKEKPYLYRSHGEPVDSYDEACKQLEENYMCADAQFASDKIDCDITNVQYSGEGLQAYYSSHTLIKKDCDKANPKAKLNDGGCAAKRCLIEISFQAHLKKISGNGKIEIDFNKYAWINGFDNEVECGENLGLGVNSLGEEVRDANKKAQCRNTGTGAKCKRQSAVDLNVYSTKYCKPDGSEETYWKPKPIDTKPTKPEENEGDKPTKPTSPAGENKPEKPEKPNNTSKPEKPADGPKPEEPTKPDSGEVFPTKQTTLTKTTPKHGSGTAHENPDRKCCGSYPRKYFYKTFHKDKYHSNGGYNQQCCGEKLFNSDIAKCCNYITSLIGKDCNDEVVTKPAPSNPPKTTTARPTTAAHNYNKIPHIGPNGGVPMMKDPIYSKTFGSGYGCWCNFKSHPFMHRGGGAPVDEFDEHCKQLEYNYVCAQKEAVAENEKGCEPWNIIWSNVYIPKDNFKNYNQPDYVNKLLDFCIKSNQHWKTFNKCRISACLAETQFLDGIKSLVDSGVSTDSYNKWDDGFETSIYCSADDDEIRQKQELGHEIGCCGEVPHSYYYNIDPNSHETTCEIGNFGIETTPYWPETTHDYNHDPEGFYQGQSYHGKLGPSIDFDTGDEIPRTDFSSWDISEYGCWCNFQETPYMFRGHGPPVDELDALCETLEYNYICVQESFKIKGKKCEPWNQDYAGWKPHDCEFIFDECTKQACIIETGFMDDLVTLLGNFEINPKSVKSNGFYKEKSCGKNPGSTGKRNQLGHEVFNDNMSCCGKIGEQVYYDTEKSECMGDDVMSFSTVAHTLADTPQTTEQPTTYTATTITTTSSYRQTTSEPVATTKFGFETTSLYTSTASTTTAPEPQTDISLGPKKQMTIDHLKLIGLYNYGCHCHFDQVPRTDTWGEPVDEIDAMCKTMNEQFYCIQKKTDEIGENGCLYAPAWNNNWSPYHTGSTLNKCKHFNHNNCDKWSCFAQLPFYEEVIKKMESGTLGNMVQDKFRADKGFNRNIQCQCKCKLGEKDCHCNERRKRHLDLECCGKWPAKRIYDPDSAECLGEDIVYGQERSMGFNFYGK